MADPTFRARIRPELHPAAAELVAIYEAVPGALTYPGCCPEGLAAVLDYMADKPKKFGYPHSSIKGERVAALWETAALLRGEQP